MSSFLRYVLILWIAIGLMADNSTAFNSRPPRNNDISNMADALKYLQDLDTYYGDRARVRFGKRGSLAQVWLNRFAMENAEKNHAGEPPLTDETF